MTTKQQPAHSIKLGRVRAAIWANETEKGTWYNVAVSRTYKSGEEWKQSATFGRDDLPLVLRILQETQTWMYEQGKKTAS